MDTTGSIRIYEDGQDNDLIYNAKSANGNVQYIRRILADDECDEEVIIDGLYLQSGLRTLELGPIRYYTVTFNTYELSRLTLLRHLVLDGINISKGLDASVFKTLSLDTMYLHKIHIHGSLSSFRYCTCNHMEISRCLFSNRRVEEVLDIDVRHLTLRYNGLSMNSIPVVKGLTSLTIIGENIHCIGSNIDRMATTLTMLYVEQCGLSGILPDVICNLSNLRTLRLPKNQLQGIIPNDISRLSNLVILNLGCNRLTGQIPVMPPYLKELNLRYNQLSGCTDTVFVPNIEILSLYGNHDLYGLISDDRFLLSACIDNNGRISVWDNSNWLTGLLTDEYGYEYKIYTFFGL